MSLKIYGVLLDGRKYMKVTDAADILRMLASNIETGGPLFNAQEVADEIRKLARHMETLRQRRLK